MPGIMTGAVVAVNGLKFVIGATFAASAVSLRLAALADPVKRVSARVEVDDYCLGSWDGSSDYYSLSSLLSPENYSYCFLIFDFS